MTIIFPVLCKNIQLCAAILKRISGDMIKPISKIPSNMIEPEKKY